MSEDIVFLLFSYLTYILGTSSPGPNILSILEASISDGRHSSIALALGITTGSAFWGFLSVFGITLFFVKFPNTIKILQVSGALYLIYLAFKSCQAAFTDKSYVATGNYKKNILQRYFQGLLIQATNPKSAITWLAVYSVALTKTANENIVLAVILGNLVLSLLIHVGYATLFAGDFLNSLLFKNRKSIQIVIAILFVCLALILMMAKMDIS